MTFALLGLASAAEPAAAEPRPRGNAPDDRLGDIQSVYAWMSSNTTKVNLVMTVSAFDDGTTAFGPGFQYVFHLAAHRAIDAPPEGLPPTTPEGEPRTSEVDIICQFPKVNEIECWAGTNYLRGNASTTTGLTNADESIRIFANRRSDPFFFNEAGFESALPTLRAHASPSGSPQCSMFTPAQATSLLSKLRTGGDRFGDTNVMALVISINKNKLNIPSRAPFLSVWGSTHRQ